MFGGPELSWLRSRLTLTPPTEHMSFSLWKDMIWGLAGEEGETSKGEQDVEMSTQHKTRKGQERERRDCCRLKQPTDGVKVYVY